MNLSWQAITGLCISLPMIGAVLYEWWQGKTQEEAEKTSETVPGSFVSKHT